MFSQSDCAYQSNFWNETFFFMRHFYFFKVLAAGIMGLTLSNKQRPSLTLVRNINNSIYASWGAIHSPPGGMYVKWFPVDIPIHEPCVHNRGSRNFLWYLFYFSLFVCLFVFVVVVYIFFYWPFADERLAVCECGLCCNISDNRVPLSGRFVQVDGFGLCLNSKQGIP